MTPSGSSCIDYGISGIGGDILKPSSVNEWRPWKMVNQVDRL